jgi:two-component system, NarL family, invasion response regulator UvrY
MIKILIADDHAIVRRGLKQILEDVPFVGSVDEAANGQEVLTRLQKKTYDLVMLDISMPGRSGIEVLKELKSEWPKLPVLVLSMYPEDQYAVRALRAGASGYLTKETAADELVTAVAKIVAGGTYVSDTLAEHIVSEMGKPSDKALHDLLSDRELQIMRMIAEGKTVKEIGDELFLSVKTISTYRTRILAKMGFRNNADLTRYALQYGLLQ